MLVSVSPDRYINVEFPGHQDILGCGLLPVLCVDLHGVLGGGHVACRTMDIRDSHWCRFNVKRRSL
jgi:hypothetical protein